MPSPTRSSAAPLLEGKRASHDSSKSAVSWSVKAVSGMSKLMKAASAAARAQPRSPAAGARHVVYPGARLHLRPRQQKSASAVATSSEGSGKKPPQARQGFVATCICPKHPGASLIQQGKYQRELVVAVPVLLCEHVILVFVCIPRDFVDCFGQKTH